ncbi:MAG: hypothetical protein ACRD6X_06790, partial [Pyrinomonadaceae bacterium]
ALTSCGLLQFVISFTMSTECGRARGRAHSGIALAYARASALVRPYFVRASAMAGLCISSRSSVVKTPNRELTRA